MTPRFCRLVLGASVLLIFSGACKQADNSDTPHFQVVAVRAEPPTGIPGGPVELALLSSDDTLDHGGSTGNHSAGSLPAEVAWLGGCHNPPGGQYYDCYPALRQAVFDFANPVDTTPDAVMAARAGVLGLGPTFGFAMPMDIIGPTHPTGMSYVFFAACRGKLAPAPDITDSVPLACLGAQHERLGRTAFEVGFATVPTILGYGNQNPVIIGLLLNGSPLTISQVNGTELELPACQSDADCPALVEGEIEQVCATSRNPGHCIPLIKRCGDPRTCPAYRLTPVIDPQSAEPNPQANTSGGSVPLEILTLKVREPWFKWDRNFTRRGGGWSDSLDSPLRVPADAPDGMETRGWVIVRDNRGGVSWVRWDFKVGG